MIPKVKLWRVAWYNDKDELLLELGTYAPTKLIARLNAQHEIMYSGALWSRILKWNRVKVGVVRTKQTRARLGYR